MDKHEQRFRDLLVGPIERFDQCNDMFRRTRYDPEWIRRAETFYRPFQAQIRDKPGYGYEEHALSNAAWLVERAWAKGCRGSGHDGLYRWADPDADDDEGFPLPRLDVSDLVGVSQKVKRAARLFGASLVGICELDQRWLYSHVSDDLARQRLPLEIPEGFRYAIAMAIEMDYDLMRTSPAGGAAAATGLGYSKMAFTAGMLAEFIRNLGYRALPCGNDTALSIPIAVQAGLGELGRNGLLITEKYGPRVRLCKVFTDLPLAPDRPRFFGVEEFCGVCLKCAQDCPSRAISFGEKTTEALNISTNPGVLKWPVNGEQCYKYWVANKLDCATCIRVCPFNQEQGWIHDLVRAGVKHAPWLNRMYLSFDQVLGYGRQRDPAAVWDG